MMGGFISVGYFLFSLVFSLILFILWARIFMRFFRISPLHPVSYGIHSLSNPVILPISKIFPNNKKRVSRYDWACLTILVAVEFLKFTLISLLFLGGMMPVQFLLVFTAADLIVQPCNLLFYAILIRVIMSWVNPAWNHPVSAVLVTITEPLLRIGRRIIPNISGFDFSPLIMMAILKIITLFISGSLPLPLV